MIESQSPLTGSEIGEAPGELTDARGAGALIESRAPLTERYDVALLDLDGVVYLAEEPIPGVRQALAQARADGMRLAFVTNNASRTPEQVASLLAKVGVPAGADEVITSAQAAAHYLADRLAPSAKVLVLGTTGLIDAVSERGLTPVFSADDAPVAVVQGFFPAVSWKHLAEAAIAIRNGAFWLATNLDSTVPSPRGPLPGNGSLVAALRHATGVEPAATGKPDPSMHRESVERSGAKAPIVVGDRLDTDIEGASRVGCASLLVLTGVTTAAALLSAPSRHRPTYLGWSAAALLQPHPAVQVVGSTVRCGSATVQAEAPALVLSGALASSGLDAPEALNGLRALAVAAWQAADNGHPHVGVRAADDGSKQLLHQLDLGG
jgi:glycerol 3-phosphatase-2